MKYIFPQGAEPDQSRTLSLVVTLIVGVILGFIIATLIGVYHNPTRIESMAEEYTEIGKDGASPQTLSEVDKIAERTSSSEAVPEFISAGRTSLISGEVVSVSSSTVVVKSEIDQSQETVTLVESTLVMKSNDSCNLDVPVLCATTLTSKEELVVGTRVRITLQQLADDAMKVASLIEVQN